MKPWQKHTLGLALPLMVSATTMLFTPEYDAPDWKINVSVAGIAIAIGYAMFVYSRFTSRGGNYFIAPAVMVVVGSVSLLIGITMQSAALAALGSLVPLSGIMLATGYLWRRSGKGESAS